MIKVSRLSVLLFFPGLFLFVILSMIAQWAVPKVAANDGTFFDTGQNLGLVNTQGVALGDVDGDSDLDAFAANNGFNQLWLNNGTAGFSTNGQNLSNQNSNGIALGNLDGDTDLDAFVVNQGANEIWVNIGGGFFSNSGQSIGAGGLSVALADLDGDMDLDAFIGNNGPNEVWLNGEGGNPAGTFSDSGQSLGTSTSRSVVIADVNGDTYLDAVVANGNSSFQPSKIWLNDGAGNFSDSGQNLDGSWNYGLVVGDLDGDTDLDILLTSWTVTGTLWINQGGVQGGTLGQFNESGQQLSNSGSIGASLADVDGDGDLDALVGKWSNGNEVWFNQGGVQGGIEGVFVDSGQSLGNAATWAVATGDLDGDNDIDVIFGNWGANKVWTNGPPGLPNPSFDVDARVNDDGNLVYPWAQSGDAVLPVLLSNPAVAPVTVYAQIATTISVTTKTLQYSPGELSKPLQITNPQPNPSETLSLTLDIDFTFLLQSKLAQSLNLVFIDTGQGQPLCYLCFVDWMVKLLGFDTSFWTLHHVDLLALKSTPIWNHYQNLFGRYSPEISTIVATNPTLLWRSFSMLETWTPAIQSLDSGQGFMVTITQGMIDEIKQLFEGIEAEAGPGLAARLNFELTALNLDSYVGLNMDEAETKFSKEIRPEIFLPVVFD